MFQLARCWRCCGTWRFSGYAGIAGIRWCSCSSLCFGAILRVPAVARFSTRPRCCGKTSRPRRASARWMSVGHQLWPFPAASRCCIHRLTKSSLASWPARSISMSVPTRSNSRKCFPGSRPQSIWRFLCTSTASNASTMPRSAVMAFTRWQSMPSKLPAGLAFE